MFKEHPGWVLGYIRDDILHRKIFRDFFISHEIRIPINQPGFNGMLFQGLFHVAQVSSRFPGILGGTIPGIGYVVT